MDAETAAQQEQKQEQEQEQEQEHEQEEEDQGYDRYKNNPNLLAESTKTARLFSFDWASGSVSPFHPTPSDDLSALLEQLDFSRSGKVSLLDLGCGDAKVLIQALETFPRSQLVRAVGVDLDRFLLNIAKEKILQGTDSHDDDYAIMPRLELYHGNITTKDEPLDCVFGPSADDMSMTMRRLLQSCSHIFVYLLPAALAKLAPTLLEAVEHTTAHTVVLSMRWPIPELVQYQVQDVVDQRFYIYSSSTPKQ
ncbi:hypothetical protein BGZ65_012078 [Modicella reniformis]|uniref:Methyltransferase domain-containing protein n=1 Tax=Modicella reniformis TaxID=1440133 RepID=A0A9P6SR95_9FUNG|nr:hypothetical protein BGZ65_012078 [Modicella reniformis]